MTSDPCDHIASCVHLHLALLRVFNMFFSHPDKYPPTDCMIMSGVNEVRVVHVHFFPLKLRDATRALTLSLDKITVAVRLVRKCCHN